MKEEGERDGGHFRSYVDRPAEIDAAVIAALWSLRGQLIGLMGLGLTHAAARHVFRHAVLDLWDLREKRKLSRRRAWSRKARQPKPEDTLVLDHAIPAKTFCDIALGIGPQASAIAGPETEEEFGRLLAALSICCVITRAEHRELERRGLRSDSVKGEEQDPYARYAKAGIEIEPARVDQALAAEAFPTCVGNHPSTRHVL